MTKLEEIEQKQQELAELIAECKEPQEFWLPEKDKIAWFVSKAGEVVKFSVWGADAIRYNDTYETKELAVKARDIHLTTNRLKQEIFKLNGNKHGKFATGEENWFLYIYKGDLKITYFEITKYLPHWMYMTSDETANSLKASHKDDLLLVLGQ